MNEENQHNSKLLNVNRENTIHAKDLTQPDVVHARDNTSKVSKKESDIIAQQYLPCPTSFTSDADIHDVETRMMERLNTVLEEHRHHIDTSLKTLEESFLSLFTRMEKQVADLETKIRSNPNFELHSSCLELNPVDPEDESGDTYPAYLQRMSHYPYRRPVLMPASKHFSLKPARGIRQKHYSKVCTF